MTNKSIQHLLRRIAALISLHNRILNSASSLWNKLWRFILGHVTRRPLGRLGFGRIPLHRKAGGAQVSPTGDSSWIAPSTLPIGLNSAAQTHGYLGSNLPNVNNGAIGPPADIWADDPASDTTMVELDISDNDPIQDAYFQYVNHAPRAITSLSLTSKSEISEVIYPTMPSKLPRYSRSWVIDPEKSSEYKLKPLQYNFSDGELPVGWEQFIHPEGGPFFWNKKKRIVTDSWLYDHEVFRVLTGFITQIDEFIRSRNFERTDDVDLVLEVVDAEGDWWCGYYFVDHSARLLLWLEPYIIDEFLVEVKGHLFPSHIELQLQLQYWNHWALFPNIIRATLEVTNLLTNALVDAQTDIVTSKESTTNLTLEELKNMMGIVNDAKASMARGEDCSTWFVGRFMSFFARIASSISMVNAAYGFHEKNRFMVTTQAANPRPTFSKFCRQSCSALPTCTSARWSIYGWISLLLYNPGPNYSTSSRKNGWDIPFTPPFY